MGISRLPFASFFVGTLILTLSACGGQPLTFNGNPPPSSATSSSSAQNSSDQSSSANSAVSSSSSSSSDPTGRELYNSARLGCSTCHGTTGQGGTSGYGIDPTDWDVPTLQDKLENMPPQTEAAYIGVFCDQACAAKIIPYILSGFTTSNAQPSASLKQSAPAYSLLNASKTSCGIAYSASDLRPLTRQEYSAAIFQLAGADLINQLGQSTYDALPPDNSTYNKVASTIDSDKLQAYSSIASQIATDLSHNNFAGIINCANLTSEECYNQLADNFACKAFRRPLTAAERSNYLSIYVAGSDNSEGVKKVISAILASSNFLYRSNIGFSQINSEGSSNLALASAAPLLQDSKTVVLNESFSLKSRFSGSDLLEISVKSTQNSNGAWPVLRVQLGESNYVDLTTNQPEATYQFLISGLKGSNSITIANPQSGALLEYQTGHSLVISSVKVALSH